MRQHQILAAVAAVLVLGTATFAAEPTKLDLSDGKMTLVAPESWKKVEPAVRIIDYEFSAPPADDSGQPGRITVMGAGGSIEANVDRWVGQFNGAVKQPMKEEKIAGQTVYIVDISGDFRDQRGPFAQATVKKDYRMLGAIIKSEKAGQYFIKFTGPKATVEHNEKAFKSMVDSLEVK
ncbi:hypothetical protein [Blastopirellula retiformator]|uniref:PsbP C-terminal domain-containing protein n=1 Tax=Blastopirellula retiformator TaxID=2527970 RepID=A0A5C5UXQ4_9BACT|nr:hypothetical protein [Blastopirellula retiformator]TWT30599.1 hypothetical protein Enr8_41200 [Blastopirellula retiformator]